MLFVLGGNGTHAGANAIHNEVATYLKKKVETFEQSFCFDLVTLLHSICSVCQKKDEGSCGWCTENN